MKLGAWCCLFTQANALNGAAFAYSIRTLPLAIFATMSTSYIFSCRVIYHYKKDIFLKKPLLSSHLGTKILQMKPAVSQLMVVRGKSGAITTPLCIGMLTAATNHPTVAVESKRLNKDFTLHEQGRLGKVVIVVFQQGIANVYMLNPCLTNRSLSYVTQPTKHTLVGHCYSFCPLIVGLSFRFIAFEFVLTHSEAIAHSVSMSSVLYLLK